MRAAADRLVAPHTDLCLSGLWASAGINEEGLALVWTAGYLPRSAGRGDSHLRLERRNPGMPNMP